MAAFRYDAGATMRAFRAHGAVLGTQVGLRPDGVYVRGALRGTVRRSGGTWESLTAEGRPCGIVDRRCDAVRALLACTDPDLVNEVYGDLDRQLVEHDEPFRPCSSCGGTCRWTDDAWYCDDCGDEWHPSDGPEYAVTP